MTWMRCPKRNFIVHGTTFQLARNDKPAQVYRIGKRKGDEAFLNDVTSKDFTAPHVFTREGIDGVTEEFVAVRVKLTKVATDVMTARAAAQS
jgi:hypothetical protein